MKQFAKRIGSLLVFVLILIAATSCAVPRAVTVADTTDRHSGVKTAKTEKNGSEETDSSAVISCRSYRYSAPDKVVRGKSVSVTLSGCLPGEEAVCRMRTESGWLSAEGLGLGVANENGCVTWTWHIGTTVKAGEAIVYLMDGNGEMLAEFPLLITSAEEETQDDEDGNDGMPVRWDETESETVRGIDTETDTETVTETNSDRPPVIYRTEYLPGGMSVTIFAEALRGAEVTLRLTGAVAGKTYTCRMFCKSGESGAEGLGEATADKNGEVVWTWKIGVRLTCEYQPTVEITGEGLAEPFSFTFTVLPHEH